AGTSGLRLLRGDGQGRFEDVTQRSGIPAAILNQAYAGVWAFDLDTEADLDLILAATSGPPVVLRNNGDGTFSAGQAFTEISNLRSFAWADLDEDADPDAALVDAEGRLHLYANDRGGLFRRMESVNAPALASIAVGDLDA